MEGVKQIAKLRYMGWEGGSRDNKSTIHGKRVIFVNLRYWPREDFKKIMLLYIANSFGRKPTFEKPIVVSEVIF